MAAVISSDELQKIAELAAGRQHRLAPDMVDGRHPLTPEAAQMVRLHLEKCPEISTPQSRQLTAGRVCTTRGAHGVLPQMSAFTSLEEGYYATPSRTGANAIDFWRVDKPVKGKWAGAIFVKRILGGGSGQDMQSVRLNNVQQRLAAQSITELGPEAAAKMFADNLGRCSACGRWLTDDESRAAGKGPVCRNK